MLRTSIRAPRRLRGAATRLRARAAALGIALTGAVIAGCYNYNITDTNGSTLSQLEQNPTRANVAAAVTGLFAAARGDITSFIWRVGSMGREGVNLSGNNQPDYAEPYFGPLSSSEFGGSNWTSEYEAIRDADIIIDAVPKAPDLQPGEKAATLAVAQTIKSLMFMYVVETRAFLGAPVDVDRAPDAPPAPFVTEDSVYATILHTLDSARVHLAAGVGAGTSFPFTLPPGYASFNTPATFDQFTWALTAKALCFRATAQSENTGGPGAAALYALALTALDSSFISAVPANFANGVYFDFGPGPGDFTNDLSEPLTGATFFADSFNLTDAQLQTGGALDQRALTKIAPIPPGTSPQVLGGIPIAGTLKFTIYLSNGNANPAAPIPVIRDEELVLLRAEAEIGTGNLGAAVTDLNTVRQGSGNLPAYSGAVTAPALINELLYNRRYSLLWEQGTRWIDARRFAVLNTIEPGWNNVSGFSNPQVPLVMPVPSTECQSRNLGAVCNPLHTSGPATARIGSHRAPAAGVLRRR